MHEHRRFDDEAATWDEAPGHEERQVAVAKAIEKAVALSPAMRALEVGGGTGRLSILLADRVGSVVVTDPSGGMVRVAQERIEAAGLRDRLRAAQADLTTDPLDGAYDAEKPDFDGHHGFDRQRLAEQLAHAGFVDVSFTDATTILKGDREFGVFLCTATKGA